MVKLVNQTIFSTTIKDKKMSVFTAADIQALFGLSRGATVMLLHRYTSRHFTLRLKRGLYALAQTPPPELFVAGKLYEPSYVSREFALSFHRVIPENVYEITSVTPKATRRFETNGQIYTYRKIKKTAFTGYIIEKQKGVSFRIADAEKALVDASYFRLLDGLKPLARFDRGKIKPTKALGYAALFGNQKLTDLVKKILP